VAKIYPVKKKLSLKENIQLVLPVMYDDVMAYMEDVVTKPHAKGLLHRMRITGKPMRYAMEIGEAAFGEDFSLCLEEVKDTVELMGEIHDADVMIPELNSHLREIRMFNRQIPEFRLRISTRNLRAVIESLKQKRKAMYDELCGKLKEWESAYFREKLQKAMGLESTGQFETAGGI